MAIINGTSERDVLQGTNDADTISGKGDEDSVFANGGNDKLLGQAGDDDLGGGPGNDVLQGGAGDDFLVGGSGNDTLTGGSGGDIFSYMSTEGNDTITDFSNGTDSVDLIEATSQELRSFYGDTIEAGDPGVVNVNGNLVINFTVAPGNVAAGLGDLIFKGLGDQALTVGTDIV